MLRTDSASGGERTAVSLPRRAYNIRRKALQMAEKQGQGYAGRALGIADVLAACYFHVLRFRADDPRWDGRDRLLLSPGHYAIALYATLMEAGVLPESELDTYGADDSRLPVSGQSSLTPGMEISGGSLGQGLGIGVGMAMGLKRKRNAALVYNLMSDGELNEGSTWEAAMAAAHHRLDNLVCLVDCNNQQADGRSVRVMATEPLSAKWEAFGWHCQRVDGNDLRAVVAALDVARGVADQRPRAIIFDTRMCRGVPFLEARERNHFMRVEPHEWAQAIHALDAGRPA